MSFTCSPYTQMNGPDVRTCQSNNTWTGDQDTICGEYNYIHLIPLKLHILNTNTFCLFLSDTQDIKLTISKNLALLITKQKWYTRLIQRTFQVYLWSC